MPHGSDEIIAAMPQGCRVAWAAYESHYIGGMGGGRHTAAKAFAAGWQGRKAAALALAYGTGRPQAGTGAQRGRVARFRPLTPR